MTTYRRRLTREKVLQVLYAYEISKEPIGLIMEANFAELKSETEDFEFAQKLVYEVISHQEELEKHIKVKVAHWEFDRIAVIDKILLSMGICELLYFPDIPPKVTINEAIEVAKTFSTEKSGQFVNGVLDAILEDLITSDSIRKTGRGLLTERISPEIKNASRHHTPKGK
jgi:N utilization substance protein B